MFYRLPMDLQEFGKTIATMGLSKSDVARLLGVTPRAVDFWLAGEREVPGPVSAYLRLLGGLPPALRAQELARLEDSPMKMDGMYQIEYAGRDGAGTAIIVLMNGIVFGHDSGVIYDGVYGPSQSPGLINLALRLTVPAGVPLVQGVPPQPATYQFDLPAVIPARGAASNVRVPTPYGEVVCSVRFLRSLPTLMAA
jgi:hypothetical protein